MKFRVYKPGDERDATPTEIFPDRIGVDGTGAEAKIVYNEKTERYSLLVGGEFVLSGFYNMVEGYAKRNSIKWEALPEPSPVK